MKPMNERSAWLYLAKKWVKPINDGGIRGSFVMIWPDEGENCICHCVHSLFEMCRISERTEDSMIAKIQAESASRSRSRSLFSYLWPKNAAGARSRAKFCRKQAALMKNRSK